jgi:L-cysteine S-thiosulfotransferase
MKCGLLIVALLITCSASAQEQRRSGREDMSAATRALQADDSQNPALLGVQQGQAAFAQQCAKRHSASPLRTPVLRYPVFDARSSKALTLTACINQCRAQHMKQPACAPQAEEALAVETFLMHQARDEPTPPVDDKRLQPALQQGQRLWQQRFGQLDLTCAQCHASQPGQRLAGRVVRQGHPTGYPIYRLERQGMGSLERRIRGCTNGVRAEPFVSASEELTALALYMKQRAAGMAVETPAVRP